MTVHDVYGTTACTAAELAQIVAGRLGLAFIEHDSYYRGVYLVADAGQSRVEIQPNAIPGDDGQDDLYAPEQPKVQTLLLVTGPTATTPSPPALTRSKLSSS